MIKFIRSVMQVMLLLLFALVTSVLYSRYGADAYLSASEKYLEAGEYSRALLYADKALDLNTLEPNYYRNRARVYLSLSLLSEESNALTYKLLALEDMKEAYRLNPNNLVTVRNLIPLYYFLAVKDAGEGNTKLVPDTNYLDITEAFYSKVWNISPNDVGVYVLLYRYTGRLELIEMQEKAATKIAELRGDLFDWYNMLD